jgi:hypothetical protein
VLVVNGGAGFRSFCCCLIEATDQFASATWARTVSASAAVANVSFSPSRATRLATKDGSASLTPCLRSVASSDRTLSARTR